MDNIKRIRHNLDLEKEGNERFYQLKDEYNEIIKKWNSLNLRLHKLNVPVIFIWKNKKELKEIGQGLSKLQKEFLDWNERAGKFYMKPNFNIPNKNKDKTLIVMRHINALNNWITRLNYDMKIIADNYNKINDDYRNQINFLIAIFSLLLTFVGLNFFNLIDIILSLVG